MGGGKGGGGGASSSVKVDSDSESTASVDILGLDDLKADVTLHLPQPLRTEASQTLDVRPLSTTANADVDTNTHLTIDPLKTDTNLSVDVKPAVVDLCLTVNVGKLPNVCVRQPYHHHIGLTLYGAEIFGVTYSGEQTTVVEELDRQPKVAWGGATTSWPPAPGGGGPAPPGPPGPRGRPPGPPVRDAGGLRVRLGP